MSLIWSVFLCAAIAWIAPSAIWSLAAEDGVDVGVGLEDVLHRADRLLAVELAGDLLDDLVLAPRLLEPLLDAVDALDADLEPGMPETIASVPSFLSSFAMYSPALLPPSLFSVPT